MKCESMIRTSVLDTDVKHQMINLNDDSFPTIVTTLSKHGYIRCSKTKLMFKRASNYDKMWDELKDRLNQLN